MNFMCPRDFQAFRQYWVQWRLKFSFSEKATKICTFLWPSQKSWTLMENQGLGTSNDKICAESSTGNVPNAPQFIWPICPNRPTTYLGYFWNEQYCQLAQNQPKSQFLFHKNCSPCDLCIMILCITNHCNGHFRKRYDALETWLCSVFGTWARWNPQINFLKGSNFVSIHLDM